MVQAVVLQPPVEFIKFSFGLEKVWLCGLRNCSVEFISEVRVEGLETMDYLDNLKAKQWFTEQGDAIVFESEMDKVHVSTPSKIATIDHEKKITFVLTKEGLLDTIVWNTCDKKTKAMQDFGDAEYKHMLRVEPAAVESPITLKPGEEWKGRLTISAVPSSYSSEQLVSHRIQFVFVAAHTAAKRTVGICSRKAGKTFGVYLNFFFSSTGSDYYGISCNLM